MVTTALQICNIALSRLRVNRIGSLTGSTPAAVHCNTVYEPALEETLRAIDWGFARKRKTGALLSTTYSGWTYAYAYPSDCVALRRIYDPMASPTNTRDATETKISFEVAVADDLASRVVLTDQEDAILIYTARVTSPPLFDSMFVNALAWRLAMELAIPLKGSTKLQENAVRLYMTTLAKAEAENAGEGHEVPEQSNSYVAARE